MNRIILLGRICNEVDLRYTPNGKAVSRFCLAVDRPYTKDGNKEADFINCQVWGKSAENCAKYLDKGKQCAVDGRLQVRSYETQDGSKRWVTEVVADRVEFLSAPSKKEEQSIEEQAQEVFGEEIVFDEADVLPF